MKKLSLVLVAAMICSLLAFGSFAESEDIDEAAAGRQYISGTDHVTDNDGTESFSNEEYWNLFDDDTSTKFCTNVLPAEITWTYDTSYLCDAFLIATANDNASYNGRNPETYTLYGSGDQVNYDVLYQGTEADVDEVNFTYFLVNFTNSTAYPYYKLVIDSATSGTLQVSEFVLIKKEVAAVSYPSSGYAPAAGSAIITGELIGNETGWGDNADAGRAAAFDGNADTFFDPLGVGDGYAGIDAGKPMILTAINILPRSGQLPRYLGAMIQGSNDGEEWTTLFTSDEEATDQVWYTITDIENNTGYRYFRYYNETSHGDVADVELYGYDPSAAAVEAAPVVDETPAAEEAPAVEEAPVVTAPAAAQTSDLVILAVVALIGTGITAVASKRR